MKKRRVFSVILFLCFIQLMYSCKSTNYLKYHRIVSEAEYSFYHNDYKQASNLYNKAFKKVKVPVENDMYFFSASLWEIGEKEKAIKLLDTLLSIEWVLTKSGYFKEMDTIMRNDIMANNLLKVKEIQTKRDSNQLLFIFEKIENKDQIARQEWMAINNEYPNDNIKKEQALRDLNSVDSLNLLTIDSLINIYGFIGGIHFPANPKIMHLSLMHQLEWVYENPKLFKKAIKQGRLFPEDYAVAYDKAILGYIKDTTVRYGQFSNYLVGVDPKIVFKKSKRIGVSPYYKEWVHFPKSKGSIPEKHFYYDYYEANKKQFKCN